MSLAGRHCAVNDKGTSAYMTVEIDTESLNGEARHVRIEQNREPNEFIRLLGGLSVVHRGKPETQREHNNVPWRAYQLCAESGEVIRLVECVADRLSLNSNYAMLLRASAVMTKTNAMEKSPTYDADVNSGKEEAPLERTSAEETLLEQVSRSDGNNDNSKQISYLWIGMGSALNGVEVAQLESIVSIIRTRLNIDDAIEILREQEVASDAGHRFWSALVGDSAMSVPATTLYVRDDLRRSPLLFQISLDSGFFSAVAVVPVGGLFFCEDDLAEEDVFLLDGGSAAHAMFVWEGVRATRDERLAALCMVKQYVELNPHSQVPLDRVFVISQQLRLAGQTKLPMEFCAAFLAWEHDGDARESMSDVQQQSWPTLIQVLDVYSRSYTLQQLADTSSRPADLDATKLENYLTDDDFSAAFGCTKAAFREMPQWKQLQLKKQIGLY
jgi:hypothetical protein